MERIDLNNIKEALIFNISLIHTWARRNLRYINKETLAIFNNVFRIAEELKSLETEPFHNNINTSHNSINAKRHDNIKEVGGHKFNLSEPNEREAARAISISVSKNTWPELC